VDHRLYADDLTLVNSGPNRQVLRQRGLDVISEWCTEFFMEVNVSKTEYADFKARNPDPLTLYLNEWGQTQVCAHPQTPRGGPQSLLGFWRSCRCPQTKLSSAPTQNRGRSKHCAGGLHPDSPLLLPRHGRVLSALRMPCVVGSNEGSKRRRGTPSDYNKPRCSTRGRPRSPSQPARSTPRTVQVLSSRPTPWRITEGMRRQMLPRVVRHRRAPPQSSSDVQEH
jgi:hypothetical protein